MPPPDVPTNRADESPIKPVSAKPESERADVGNAAYGNKAVNEAYGLLGQNLLTKTPLANAFGKATNSDLFREGGLKEAIQYGKLLVPSLWPQLKGDAQTKGQPREGSRPADKPSTKPFLRDTEPTAEEFEFLQPSLPVSPELQRRLADVMAAIEREQKELWRNVKDLVNRIGRSPKEALIEAMKRSRVLGIGEMHTINGDNNALRNFGATVMRDLHDQGKATHLAVELPKVLQPVLDKFNKDPKKGELEIPDKIIGPDGKEDTSPEARGGLKLLRAIKEKSPDLIKVFTAARDAGMKIACVDNNANALQFANPAHPDIPRLMSQRDADMKDNIMHIVDQPWNPTGPEPPSKVVAWLGGLHFADSAGKEELRSVGELLRNELATRLEAVTTFMSQIGDGRTADGTNLYVLTSQLNRPVSVPTRDREGHQNALSQIHLFRQPQPGFPNYNLSSFDNVLVFPRTPAVPQDTSAQIAIDKMTNMKPAPESKPASYLPETADDSETARVGNQEKVKEAKREINASGQPPSHVLSEAMKNNRVLGIGMGFYEEGYEQHVLATMQKLKEAGATHLAVAFKQEALDEFMKTGKVDASLVTAMPGNVMILVNMQAALQNGIKLVSSDLSGHSDGFSSSSKDEIEAVKTVLKDKNAKVILLTTNSQLANSESANDGLVTGQLIRNEPDPANPGQKIKFVSVKDVKTDDVLEPVSSMFRGLKEPIAIPLRQTKEFAKLKAGYEFNFKKPATLDTWDIVMVYPQHK